jgi:hypothetical protein
VRKRNVADLRAILGSAVSAFFIFSASAFAENEHWQWAVAGFYGYEQNESAKVQLTYAPNSALIEEGLRFRYEGRLSGWDDRDPLAPRAHVLEAEDSLYIGTSIHNGPWRVQLYGGATVFSDNQYGFDTRFGASAIAEVLWLGTEGEFAALEARGSSISSNWALSFVSGWPTGYENLKLGPEAGVSGNVTGWNARLGVAATGLTLANCDFALGAGALVDDQERVAPYVSVWLSGKF